MVSIASDDYLESPHFSPRERAVILWAEHVAKNTAGSRHDIFAEVKQHLSDGELIELTAVCGLFAMLNRFQDSLHLPIDEPATIDRIRRSVRLDSGRIKAYLQFLIDEWPSAYPTPQKDDVAGTIAKAARLSRRPWIDDCRVAFKDANATSLPAQRWFDAVESLLGSIPFSVRVWADLPYLGMLCLPFHVALEREGAGCLLPSALKALVLIRTSHLNEAPYSLAHYEASGLNAGLSAGKIESIQSGQALNSAEFSSREAAALLWADHVAANTAKRNEEVFHRVKAYFNDAELVELTVLCATTNMVNRMHNALRLPLEPASDFAVLHRSNVLDPQRLKMYLETALENWSEAFPARGDEDQVAAASASAP